MEFYKNATHLTNAIMNALADRSAVVKCIPNTIREEHTEVILSPVTIRHPSNDQVQATLQFVAIRDSLLLFIKNHFLENDV